MLISVKNPTEARIAAANEGVSIVDVKDPLQGSLGFAGAAIVNQIAALVHEANSKSISAIDNSCNNSNSRKKLVSIALGELDSLNKLDTQQIDWAKISYAKVGLSDAYKDCRWRKRLADFFSEVPSNVARVFVIYVDQISATASQESLTAAHEDGMSVVLLDTFDKSRGNVFFHWSDFQCKSLFKAAAELGIQTVLAGSIEVSNLPLALKTQTDLIGVRGAVCEGDREGELSQQRLSDFIEAYSAATSNHCCIDQAERQSLTQPLSDAK